MPDVFRLGPVQFEQPVWLLFLVPAVALVVWLARSSLSDMGSASRRVALVVRVVVLVLLVGALARPHWRSEAENVTVTAVIDSSESIPRSATEQINRFLADAADFAEEGDLTARVSVGRDALVTALPRPAGLDQPLDGETVQSDATNLGDGIRRAMAIMPGDTANRIALFSDGNETVGDLLSAASAAKAAGVIVDVVPIRYTYESEVIAQNLVVPANVRTGQNIDLRVLLDATAPARGTLNLTINGDPVDLNLSDPDSLGAPVELRAGIQPFTIPIRSPGVGANEFRVWFEPELGADGNPVGDVIDRNNEQVAVTFVQADGNVLVLYQDAREAKPIMDVLEASRIGMEARSVSEPKPDLLELSTYDAVVLVNTPSYSFDESQQADLRRYVHDLGGGLVMVGGADSFGAGGWIGSPLEVALPIRLDPPEKRNTPRGALVMIMHSCEMPSGNFWGQKIAETAVGNLTARDLAGVVEYNWQKGGADWVHPLSMVGNRAAINRAIGNLTFGDAPDFHSMMQLAIGDLERVTAGAKHCIIVSDGDPSPPSQALVNRFVREGVTVSTVLVFPHSMSSTGPEAGTMQRIANQTGGEFYWVIDQGGLAELPSIIIKEVEIVRRTLIYEGDPFSPTISSAGSEPMRGITATPMIDGYVVAADREGLSLVTMRGPESDPICAQWQHGLGKVVTFTSDTGARWAEGWPGWGGYRSFWEQHVRWVMRPGGSADVRVVTEDLGERTRVLIDILNEEGDPLNFVRFSAGVAGPNKTSPGLDIRQIAPGKYEGFFDSGSSGAYLLNLNYRAPSPGGGVNEGSVRAAVTRPFADEYRALADNTALLRAVAEKTGGRLLTLDAREANLWDREGLEMPVALSPEWMLFSLLGIGLFLADVAVRRVRFDPSAILATFRRGVSTAKSRGGEQIGSLQEARKRAQQSYSGQPAGASSGGVGGGEAGAVGTSGRGASAKFEASDEELAGAGENIGAATYEQRPEGRRSSESGQSREQAGDEEGGISRLKQAKQRAKQEFDKDRNDKGDQ